MKKLLRILPYLTMVWVAMYVRKETGKITWNSDDHGMRWATKKQCMKVATKIRKDRFWLPDARRVSVNYYKPVCYRLTKYSTR